MGPLLPTDDVKAMLKRIIDGVPVPAEEEPDTEPQDAPTAASEEAPQIADAAPLEPETAPETDGVPLPMSDLHAPVAVAAVESPEVVQSTLPRPRLRRHGGAMPS